MKNLQLRCNNLTIAYDRVNVFENVKFDVYEGDYLSIVGENGSGKSSLLKGILGLVPIKKGEVVFENGMTKKNIGYLPQHTAAQRDFPASVYEVILSGCLANIGFRPFYTSKEKKSVKKIMEKLGIKDLAGKTFGNLSGGQKQRVLLARALLATDKVLFLDEPVTGLDPLVTSEFYEVISKLNKEEKLTIIMVSHDIENAMKYSNKILHMKDNDYFFGTKEEYIESMKGTDFLNYDR